MRWFVYNFSFFPNFGWFLENCADWAVLVQITLNEKRKKRIKPHWSIDLFIPAVDTFHSSYKICGFFFCLSRMESEWNRQNNFESTQSHTKSTPTVVMRWSMVLAASMMPIQIGTNKNNKIILRSMREWELTRRRIICVEISIVSLLFVGCITFVRFDLCRCRQPIWYGAGWVCIYESEKT